MFKDFFRVESHSPQVSAAYTRTKNADWLDVAASPNLDQVPIRRGLKDLEQRISVRRSVYTLRRSHHDRCELVRLSKIAHIRRMGIARFWMRKLFTPLGAVARARRVNRIPFRSRSKLGKSAV